MQLPNRKKFLIALLAAGLGLWRADAFWPPAERGLRLEIRAPDSAAGEDALVREGVDAPRGVDDFSDALARFPDGFSAEYTGLIRLAHPGVYHFQTWGGGHTTVEVGGAVVASHRREDGEIALRTSRRVGEDPGRGTFYPIRIRFDFTPAPDATPHLNVHMNKEVYLTKPIPRRILYPPGTATWRYGLQWTLRGVWIPCLVLAALEMIILAFGLRRASRVYFPFAAVVASVLVFLVGLEVILRILGAAPREYVPGDIWAHYRLNRPGETTLFMGYLPGSVKEFEVPVTFNARGWRDDDHEFARPPGVYRILITGDSFVDGKEVEFDRTFHQILERRLNEERAADSPRVEVIVLARGGIGTDTELDFIRDEGLKYEPDLVILSFYTGNDVADNSPVLRDLRESWIRDIYTFRVSNVRTDYADRWLVFRRSWVNRHLTDRLVDHVTANIHRYQPSVPQEEFVSPDTEVFDRGPYDPVWEQAWRRSKGLVLETRELARSAGAEFMLLIAHSARIPVQDPVVQATLTESRLDPEKPARILREFCGSLDVDYADTYPALTGHEAETGEPYYWNYDTHWNETGHRIVAELLLEKLRGRIPPPESASSGDARDAGP